MIKFAYVIPEDEAGFTTRNYIEVTLDIHSSGVMKSGLQSF